MRKAARTVKPNARTGERHTWKDRERRRKEERQRMAAEALIVEDAYQRGYADAIADMRKKKEQVVKKLIQCAAIIAAGVLAIILFMLAIWYRGKNSEPVTDEQVAAQMQQAEPLVIETPEAATEGSIRVYDYDGCCIYSYYGKIRINSDGKDGKDIDVEAIGYLEGYQEHKDESEAGNE